jgi:hypothetical protein
MKRDEFPKAVVDEVAKRAGYRCSFPGCPSGTVGPKEGPTGFVTTGEAGHIHAASDKGPRWKQMAVAERTSVENAILLCEPHHPIVDRDDRPHPPELLKQWKALAESRARVGILTCRQAIDQTALLAELPGVANIYQLQDALRGQFYTHGTTEAIRRFVQLAGGDRIMKMATKLACEI